MEEHRGLFGRIKSHRKAIRWTATVAAVLVLVAGGIFAGYTISNWKSQDELELQQLQISFASTYGAGKTWTQQPVKQTDIFVVYWQDNTKAYASAFIGGLWVQIASAPLAVTPPASTPIPNIPTPDIPSDIPTPSP